MSAAADQDRDGIKDACEQALIKAFEPEMVFYYYEIWHAREPHYIVERVNGVVTLGYLLSFYYDGGKVSHNGDSEMVIIRLAPSGQTSWAIGSITTTAHYGATFGWIFDETRTNGWQAFQFTGSHPRVFASNNHHGLYESEGRCDDRSYDSCSSGRPTVSFGVAHIDGIIQMLGQSYLGMDGLRPDNNIGNTATRLVIDAYGRFGTTPGGMTGCTYADNPSRPGFECYFKYGGYSQDPFGLVLYGGSFAGWSGQSGTTSYHSLLDDFGFNDPYR